MSSDGFEIVFVCTGNQARSPTAEALLARQVDAGRVSVRSVGTHDVGPTPALPAAVRAAASIGLDLSSHQARTMRVGEFERANLVVGFEPGHISAAVIDGRASLARTFTLVELGLLLEGMPTAVGSGASPASVVRRAHELRTTGFLHAPAVADPQGGSDDVFARTLTVIDHHVSTIASAILGVAMDPTQSV